MTPSSEQNPLGISSYRIKVKSRVWTISGPLSPWPLFPPLMPRSASGHPAFCEDGLDPRLRADERENAGMTGCENKNPRRFPAGGRYPSSHSYVRDRNRDGRGSGIASCRRRRRVVAPPIGTSSSRQDISRQACAHQLGVHHVQTQVEVLGDIPLGARTEPPGAPVIVAARGGNSRRTSLVASTFAASRAVHCRDHRSSPRHNRHKAKSATAGSRSAHRRR